ncbi:CHAD domain-containing protein [Chelatococcus daeguensis]|uniref:CHAD domain-containing protein n=1 Tax=Chelatococcus daeguensis TaxID=444444 RepID=UPI0007AB7502|nr:CHAD domain-containing protein [Chelatococcus daeguensis]KZE34556.1 hypothetical protein AVW15_16990 [Chelatococcus daeguensis]MBM3083114.1 CHAD domain-containing protein [Chelatococcus daeguensis]
MDARPPTIAEHALDPSLPADEALRQLARALLADMSRALDTFDTMPAPAAHETRKGIKALRALLRLADPACGQLGDIDTQLRDSAALLAGAREARVLAGTLGDLVPRARGTAAAPLARLCRWADEYATIAEAEALGHRRAAQVAEILLRLAAGVDNWPLPDAWPHLIKGAKRTGRRARQRLAKGLASGDAEELHAARRWVVRHRYHLGFLAAAGRLTETRRKRMQDLRDLLGRHHDLHDARQTIARAGLVDGAEFAAIDSLVCSEQRRLEKKIARAADRLFDGDSRRLAGALKATFGKKAG